MSEHPEPPFDTALRAIDRWSETVGQRLLRMLSPIYGEGFRHPELIGSGVLIRANELVFLVSAAHVADDVRPSRPHYFGALGQLLPLPSLRFTSPLPASGSRDDDRVDLAYWVLDPSVSRRMPSAETLFLSQLQLTIEPRGAQAYQYLVNGYPHTRQPRRFVENEFAVKDFGFITDELDEESYAKASVDRDHNILVEFDREDVFRRGQQVLGPDLQGVSGGALWALDGRSASPQRPLLAGIVTTWRRAAPKGIIATRIAEWARIAASQFPEVAAVLRRQVFGNAPQN